MQNFGIIPARETDPARYVPAEHGTVCEFSPSGDTCGATATICDLRATEEWAARFFCADHDPRKL